MSIHRQKLAHLWERDTLDFYVEPEECSIALFAEHKFQGPIWDPACGLGRITDAARLAGYKTISTDIKKRSPKCDDTLDFLSNKAQFIFTDIVSNPPFSLAEEFVKKSLSVVPRHGQVAMILPIVWIAGFSRKRNWLPASPLKKVLPISPRPSMPPGAVILAGERAGNGTKDYAWFVWQRGYSGNCEVGFLNTRMSGMHALRNGGTNAGTAERLVAN